MNLRKILKDYYLSTIEIILIIIVSFLSYIYHRVDILGSILVAGVTAWGLIYNIEHERYKSKQKRENVKEIIAIEVGATTSNLEKFLNEKINISELKTGNNIQLWYKFSNHLCEVFKTDTIRLLNEFFTNLKKIEEIAKSRTNDSFRPLYLYEENVFIETVKLGEKILKIEDEENKLKLDKSKISISEYYEIINLKEYENLEQRLLELNKEKLGNFLEKSINPYFEIDKNQIFILIEFLSKHGKYLEENFSEYTILSIIENIILKIKNQEQRFDTIKKYTEESTSLWTPLILFHTLILFHKEKIYYNELFKQEKKLNKKQLTIINNILLKKIDSWNKKGKLLSCYRLYDVLSLWGVYKNKDVVKKFIKDSLNEEKKITHLINGFNYEKIYLSIEEDNIEREFKVMKEFMVLEYVKEELDKIKYPNKNKDLIEEFKGKLEEYISNDTKPISIRIICNIN